MKIIVTGATGFIGSHLVKALLSRGHELICPVRSVSSTLTGTTTNKFIEYLTFDDLLKLHSLKNKNVSLVIHLATSYGRGPQKSGELSRINYHYPMKLLGQCSSEGIPFLNTDSFFNTESLQNNLKEYALSKKLFLQDAKSLANGKNKLINLRLEHVYGPNDRIDKFIPWLIKNMLMNTKEIILTDCIQKRDFIYIDDVVSAYITVVNALDIFSEGGYSSFGVGTGASVPVRLLVEKCYSFTNSKSYLAFGKKVRDCHEIMDSCADIANLTALGWGPTISLDKGVLSTIKYCKSLI